MKLLRMFFCGCSAFLMAAAANAAGTYYTGNYQSPQQSRYTQKSYANTAAMRSGAYSSQGVSAYNRSQYANAGYVANRSMQNSGRNVSAQQVATSGDKNGFYLGAGLSKQTAMWQFEMNSAGSKLHYDNVDWLVFDVAGKYVFDAGNTKMQIDAGLQYGMQGAESGMVDDDISHGGYDAGSYVDKLGNVVGQKFGHAMSVGTSDGGNMFGFHAGFGLTDMFKIGSLKITPSVGWRHLKYKLETSNNYGMVMVNGDWDNACVDAGDGSVQCWPLIALFNGYNDYDNPDYPGYDYIDGTGDGYADIAGVPVGNWTYAEAEGTFYFEQMGVSHSYDVTWSGPYVALDMQYDVNPNNYLTARVEVGLPSYTAEGDQPYRYDWAHPKSVEDKGGIGSAFHFGAGVNWTTALSKSVALSIGVTYDYYNVSGADATTYLNPEYWTDMYNSLVDAYIDKFGFSSWEQAENVMLNGGTILNGSTELELKPNATAVYIYESAENGWKDKVDSEIESFYKSLGIRVGLSARF